MALGTRPIELLHRVSNVYRIMCPMTPAEVSNYLKYVEKVTARTRPQLYQRLDGGALPILLLLLTYDRI